jgi:septal ring factor EnvC (AmiA/AmiB activator)
MGIKSFIVISSIFLMVNVQANVQSLKLIQGDLRNTEVSIKDQNDEIKRIESNLGSKNKTYLTTINIKRKIREEIYKIDEKIIELEKSLNIKEEQLGGIIMQYVASGQSGDGDVFEELERSLTVEGLKGEVKSFQEMKDQFTSLKSESSNLTLKLHEYEIAENEVFELIKELEREKIQRSQDLTSKSEKRNELKKKLQQLARTKTREKLDSKSDDKPVLELNVKGEELVPLRSVMSWEKHKNGVNLVAESGDILVAPRSGKVIYVGQLSAFGNVILLEHENGIKSVLLGEIESKVEKGEEIQKGQELGLIKNQKNLPAKVYFEYRLDNQSFITDNLMSMLKSKTINNKRISL